MSFCNRHEQSGSSAAQVKLAGVRCTSRTARIAMLMNPVNTYRNPTSNVIKRKPAEPELITIYQRNGQQNLVKQYPGYDTAETSFADTGMVPADILMEQTEYEGDAAGNLILTTRSRRSYDATETGTFTSPQRNPDQGEYDLRGRVCR